MNTSKVSQEIKIDERGTDRQYREVSTMEKGLNAMTSALTVSQHAGIGFTAGVAGALAVVLFSQILSLLGIVAKGPIPFPLRFHSPGIYQPLFWGGLWGVLFGLLIKNTSKRLYLFGFLYTLAPMLATFLFFLPRGGAGYFGLEKAGPIFPLYVLLVNVPFGLTMALVVRTIINQSGTQLQEVSTAESDANTVKSGLTLSQRAAIGFAPGVIGAAAVVVCSYVLFGLGVSGALGINPPVPLKSPDIYRPLFWGGLWGVLFGLVAKPAWNRLYLVGFLYVLAPLIALFLFFLPMSGAGFFGLNRGANFTAYLLLVNLPFGIVTALAARAIIGKHP